MEKRIKECKKNGFDNVYFTFIKEYFKNLSGIGSILPDSNFCFDSLLKHVPFDSAEVILEFGAGSGTVTREIIKRKRPETVLVSFEKNGTFFDRLSKNLGGQNVYFSRNDVFKSQSILSDEVGMKRNSIDCIVSTLPCSSLNFDRLLRNAVVPLLKDGGFFIQYMHVLSLLKGFRLRPHLRKHFSMIHKGFVLRNVPPVFIYTCLMEA